MDKKIYFVFILVVLIGVSNAIISTITIRNSKKIVYNISLVVNPSIEKIEEFNLVVTKSRMLITNWVYLPSNQNDKDSLLALNNKTYPHLKSSLQLLMRKWNTREHEDKMTRLFYAYEQLVENENKIITALTRFDDYQDPMKKFAAEEQIENEIIPRSNAIMLQLKELTVAKKKEASILQNKMIESYYYLLVMVLGLAVLIIVSVILAGGYMLRKVIVPLMKIREVILQMSKGELPDFNLKFSYNALGEMSYAIRQLIDGLKRTANFAGEIGKGNLDIPFTPLSQKDVFGSALIEMRKQLANASASDAIRNWTNNGVATLGSILHKNIDDIESLCEEIITGLVTYIQGQQGAIYLINKEQEKEPFIEIKGFYGINKSRLQNQRISLKQGLVGQCISLKQKISVPGIVNPEYYIETGLTKSNSCHVLIVPLYVSGQVIGAIEIVTFELLSEIKIDFITRFAEPVASNIFNLKANLLTKKLLEESQKQAQELSTQDEELRQKNNELTIQSKLLKFSEEELKKQQEDLKNANAELMAKTVLLEEKNMTIEDARLSIVFKAEQLEKSNKYKSAFLANMSHELRTPLNSVLILAKLLSDNREKNLTEKQTEYARVIYKSGSDLLYLINDILDISKIESGKVELYPEVSSPKSILNELYALFKELANEKGIQFQVKIGDAVPDQIITDRMRLDQILKNLLSNAFKFTPAHGTVSIEVDLAGNSIANLNSNPYVEETKIAITVRDTGIGIPPEKQQLIFEAFKQADGSTNRKFGGTGLGLAISKELANLLGGDLIVSSIEGQGSSFTLFLPDKLDIDQHIQTEPDLRAVPHSNQTEFKNLSTENGSYTNPFFDDRQNIKREDKRILVIDDDPAFNKMLLHFAHQHQIKIIAISKGDLAIKVALDYNPDAIFLNLQLPDIDGRMVLKQLKNESSLKMIPVYILTGLEKKNPETEMSDIGFLRKPADRSELEKIFLKIKKTSSKKIMLVENRKKEMQWIINLLREKEQNSYLLAVDNMADCIENMKKEKFESIILNAKIVGFPENKVLLETLEKESALSGTKLCIYDESNEKDTLAFVNKSLNLTSENFTENNVSSLSNENIFEQNARLPKIHFDKMPDILKGKKVIVVDDDMRNIYSLTSILEEEGLHVICAYNGQEAIQKLNDFPDTDIVLMDIMMPEMNGYEAIKHIRNSGKFPKLPIIALTAKAMSGDREKCLEAGASDYLSKPLNIEQLISWMKIWLYR